MLRSISADGLVAFPGWETGDGQSRILRLRSERSIVRQSAGGRLFLYIELVYVVAEDKSGLPHTRTLSYVYTVFDAKERRVLGWHYHPQGRAGESVPTPHLHVYVDIALADRSISKLHIPTGPVGLHDVIAFLIEQMGVQPREQYRSVERGTPRWRRILRESSGILARLEASTA